MDKKITFGLYLMAEKGISVLQQLLENEQRNHIAYVVSSRDAAIAYDAYDDIRMLASNSDIPNYDRADVPKETSNYKMAIAWRWLIPLHKDRELIVFHDAILPKYRGFSPLVSALINGDEKIGVSAIFATKQYDEGDILGQEIIDIKYPMMIAQAITEISSCYRKLASRLVQDLITGHVSAIPQDHSSASYSLWRDENDYLIDWSLDAEKIKRFVDATGYPYHGASTYCDGELFRINECGIVPDVKIINRTPGKIIFIDGVCPIVVCGQGLMKITHMTKDGENKNTLPLKRFRMRFGSHQTLLPI